MTPEQKLWQAVILQAVQDALRKSPRGMDTKRDCSEAQSFFETPGAWTKWLEQCCLMAGYEPDYVREGYEKAKRRGSHTAFLSAVGKKNISTHKTRSVTERKQSPYNKHGNGYRGARHKAGRKRQ